MDSHVGSSSLLKQVLSNALITTGIIIARIIKRGGKKSRNQYRIPFAALVKTREIGREGGRREERASERGREGMDGGREVRQGGKAGREGGREGGAGVGC